MCSFTPLPSMSGRVSALSEKSVTNPINPWWGSSPPHLHRDCTLGGKDTVNGLSTQPRDPCTCVHLQNSWSENSTLVRYALLIFSVPFMIRVVIKSMLHRWAVLCAYDMISPEWEWSGPSNIAKNWLKCILLTS